MERRESSDASGGVIDMKTAGNTLRGGGWLAGLCVTVTGICGLAAVPAPAAPSFDRDIRPILKAACTHCHGEEEPVAGSVDLRLRRFLLEATDSGEPVIVPGDPDASLLVRVVESGEMLKGERLLSSTRPVIGEMIMYT